MSIFSQLKQKLIKQLAEQRSFSGLMEYQASVRLSAEEVALLGWLKAQNDYPHFFWQSRDSDFAVASVGAVHDFSSLEEAEQFSRKHQTVLLGGLRFEGECRFILPRLKLVKNAENLTACFYLKTEERSQQVVVFEQFFANFEKTASLTLAGNMLTAGESVYNFEDWQANIEKAVGRIRADEFNKVVLANAQTLSFERPISAYDLLAESRRTNLGCYHFLWAENALTAFIGSSPERLYQRTGRALRTEALAGTAAVTHSEVQTKLNAEWLLTDPKNIYENQLVVDDIYVHLHDCVTEIEVDDAQIKRLHNVQHLRRNIRAILKAEVSDCDCLSRIHPTAAVAGLPRQPAKRFIAENECFPRGWYAGALGFFSPQQAEFCVTLRSGLIRQNRITLYAGAGIVEESEPMSEWQEIERKSLALAKLLKIS